VGSRPDHSVAVGCRWLPLGRAARCCERAERCLTGGAMWAGERCLATETGFGREGFWGWPAAVSDVWLGGVSCARVWGMQRLLPSLSIEPIGTIVQMESCVRVAAPLTHTHHTMVCVDASRFTEADQGTVQLYMGVGGSGSRDGRWAKTWNREWSHACAVRGGEGRDIRWNDRLWRSTTGAERQMMHLD